MPTADPILELTEEHADGTWFVDGEGDLWHAVPLFGWVVTQHGPFGISSTQGTPMAKFGPYIAVLAPPERGTPEHEC